MLVYIYFEKKKNPEEEKSIVVVNVTQSYVNSCDIDDCVINIFLLKTIKHELLATTQSRQLTTSIYLQLIFPFCHKNVCLIGYILRVLTSCAAFVIQCLMAQLQDQNHCFVNVRPMLITSTYSALCSKSMTEFKSDIQNFGYLLFVLNLYANIYV